MYTEEPVFSAVMEESWRGNTRMIHSLRRPLLNVRFIDLRPEFSIGKARREQRSLLFRVGGRVQQMGELFLLSCTLHQIRGQHPP